MSIKKIVLFANSSLAIPALQILISNTSCAGIVMPHYQHHANQNIRQHAQQHNIPVLISDKVNFKSKLHQFLHKINPELAVVLTFPFRIPSKCLEQPSLGFYNFHPGLLPEYRGPDPVFWQIRNREKYGGISIHKMTERIDEGPLLMTEVLEIKPEDTYGMHWYKLQTLVFSAMNKFMNTITSDLSNFQYRKQDIRLAKYWPSPIPDDLEIHWKKAKADDIRALANASNPSYQGATTSFNQFDLRLFEVEKVEYCSKQHASPGTWLNSNEKNAPVVACINKEFIRLNTIMLNQGVISGKGFATFIQSLNLNLRGVFKE